MTNQLQSALLRAATSTFEELGFVFPETTLEDEQIEAPLVWKARLSFHGPSRGDLEIRFSDDVADEVTANMLGMYEDVDPAQKRDALGEVANVVCGNFVPSLSTPDAVFRLGAPVVTEIGADAGLPGETPDAELVLGIDRGRVGLAVYILEGAVVESAS